MVFSFGGEGQGRRRSFSFIKHNPVPDPASRRMSASNMAKVMLATCVTRDEIETAFQQEACGGTVVTEAQMTRICCTLGLRLPTPSRIIHVNTLAELVAWAEETGALVSEAGGIKHTTSSSWATERLTSARTKRRRANSMRHQNFSAATNTTDTIAKTNSDDDNNSGDDNSDEKTNKNTNTTNSANNSSSKLSFHGTPTRTITTSDVDSDLCSSTSLPALPPPPDLTTTVITKTTVKGGVVQSHWYHTTAPPSPPNDDLEEYTLSPTTTSSVLSPTSPNNHTSNKQLAVTPLTPPLSCCTTHNTVIEDYPTDSLPTVTTTTTAITTNTTTTPTATTNEIHTNATTSETAATTLNATNESPPSPGASTSSEHTSHANDQQSTQPRRFSLNLSPNPSPSASPNNSPKSQNNTINNTKSRRFSIPAISTMLVDPDHAYDDFTQNNSHDEDHVKCNPSATKNHNQSLCSCASPTPSARKQVTFREGAPTTVRSTYNLMPSPRQCSTSSYEASSSTALETIGSSSSSYTKSNRLSDETQLSQGSDRGRPQTSRNNRFGGLTARRGYFTARAFAWRNDRRAEEMPAQKEVQPVQPPLSAKKPGGIIRSISRAEARAKFKAAVLRVGRAQMTVNHMLTSQDSFSMLTERTRKSQAKKELSLIARIRKRLTGHHEIDEFSDITTKYRPDKIGVYQDMSHPLAHYFVASGHNSYLTGNQFTSNSSTKPIIAALEGGCRVIELDLWNGKTEPRVTHGYTMTKPVTLTKCLRVINKYAFKCSDFPVIITIENHLNQKNKLVLAQLLHQEFGEKLYRDKSAGKRRDFPSPEELKGKILIRDKDDRGDGKEDHMQLELRNSKPLLSRKISRKWERNLKQEDEDDNSPDPNELRELISIFNLKHTRVVRRRAAASSSQGEGHFEMLQQNNCHTIKHTQRHLLRTYPGGKRVDSSNYDPNVAWSFGAQIVAVNWQTPGPQMWVYRGMFSDNGRCGYVLKPEWMLSPTLTDLDEMPVKKMLRVRILSGRHMRHRSLKENLVGVDLFGAPKDCRGYRSASVRAYDACTWDQEFIFQLCCPDVAVLLLTLMTDNMQVEGQVAVPVRNMSFGKFFIPLMNKHGLRFGKRHRKRHMSLVVEFQLAPVKGSIRKMLG